jgi:dipeptidyl aminopeptidase/acylaminoacyl peptidase
MQIQRQPISQKKRSRLKTILILGTLFAIILVLSKQYIDKVNSNMSEKQLIPRAVLFGNPDRVGIKISPDGNNTTYIAPLNGVLNIFLAKENKLDQAKTITNDTHRGIREYAWSYDNKHVIYSQDKDGDENDHLFSINIDSGEIVELTPFKGAKAGINTLSKYFPDYALVMLNDRRKDLFDLYLLNLKNNKIHLIYQNDQYAEIDIDENFQMRFATMSMPDGSARVDIFQKQERSISELIKLIESNATDSEVESFISEIQEVNASEFMMISPEDLYTTSIVGFTNDYDRVYMLDSRNRDKAGLFELDIKTKAQKLVFESDKADVQGIIQNPDTKAIEAVAINYTRDEWKFFNSNVEKVFDEILKKFGHDGEVQITSRSLDDKTWTAAVTSDTAPPQYYKVNTETSKVEFLFSGDTKLDKYELVKMHPIVIKARDGMELVSYLTVPKDVKVVIDSEKGYNVKTDKTVPLVMYVHGGPTARDDWGLDKTHQWLADRGYAVLSVNYRGSTGFGKNFINAGNGEWSRKMHDDIIDAANWAVANGVTSQDKIGIMGGSYGGYEALVGVTFTPDFFRCAVDIVGPSNLVTLLESVPPYWKPFIESLNRKTGGNVTTEEGKKELLDRSPITFVDKISKPLLIGQGANDPRVKQAESDQIVKSMQEKGIPVIYALYPDEGHGFARPENRMSFFVLTEYFLHENLGGYVEKFNDDFKGTSLKVEAGAELLPNDVKTSIQK